MLCIQNPAPYQSFQHHYAIEKHWSQLQFGSSPALRDTRSPLGQEAFSYDSKSSMCISICCPKRILKPQPGRCLISQPTWKLCAMNSEVLTQTSFTEKRNNTAHISSSNIWVLGPSGSENLGEYPGRVNSTRACADALKSTPDREVEHWLLHVHRQSL